MLAYLSVKGFAIIDTLKVEFKDGFNVITGETGAGKSIIVHALSTLMNSKLSSDVVRANADQAEIIGHFIEGPGSDEYILKRIVSNSGRSRAFFNDEPVTLTKLESLGSMLVSIYGQNEFQHLLNKENYTSIIDNLLSLSNERETLSAKVDVLRKTRSELEIKKKEIEGAERERELLEFEIDEIEEKQMKENEEEDIRERLRVLKSAEKIRSAFVDISEGIQQGDNSAQSILKRSLTLLRPFGTIEPIDTLRSKIESLSFDLEDVLLQMKSIERSFSFDTDEMEKLDERLSEIFRLKDKYGKTYDEIVNFASSARDRLTYLKGISTDISELTERMRTLESEVESRARTLSEKRKDGCIGIEKQIIGELGFLSMKGLDFKVEIKDKESIDRDGRDDIDLLISTNPGEPLKPLRKTASGGELSRIMLAIKKVIGGEEEKTLIFDEVDAGIGGKVADIVGRRLHDLGKRHQVLCITHLPQIAAYGDHHFLVEKVYSNGKTRTGIRELSKDDRVREIARMIGGETITAKAVDRAEEMLHYDQKSAR